MRPNLHLLCMTKVQPELDTLGEAEGVSYYIGQEYNT